MFLIKHKIGHKQVLELWKKTVKSWNDGNSAYTKLRIVRQ